MKRIAFICLCCLLFAGCASMYPVGGFYTEVKWPNQVTTEDVTHTKVGTAKATSILTLFAFGDASIDTAIQNGGITKVKYVDYDARNILGIYGEYTTTVYGD